MKSSLSLLSSAAFTLVSIAIVACGGSADPTSQTESQLGAVSTSSGDHTDPSSTVSSVPECKGALPDICEICPDGKSECAHFVIVDGKCEIQICPSPSTTPPKEPATAAVCKGPLPDICEVCADGKEECAHWVRVDGKCEVQICSNPSTTPPEPAPASGSTSAAH
jgi:hypothetical protein